MNLGPGTETCPPWLESDAPPAITRNVNSAYRRLYLDVLNCAQCRIANDETFRRWHEILFEGHPPIAYYAGNYRQIADKFPCLACNVEVDGVRGSEFQNVLLDMKHLAEDLRAEISSLEIRWPNLNPQERTKRIVLLLATSIGTFIRIHPFVNRNGHISRVIWKWGLARFGVPMQVRISPRPEDPYSAVMARSMVGDDVPLARMILAHLARHPPALNA